MQTQLRTYLNFSNNARAAMEFYKTVFGGKLTMQTFKEFGVPGDPADDNKIMHAVLENDNGIQFMASDTPSHIQHQPGTNISMSLTGDNEAELQAYYQKLSAGGQVTLPLDKSPWGDTFGMCTDKFGIQWMVNIEGKKM